MKATLIDAKTVAVPPELRSYLAHGQVYDCSSSPAARTYRLVHADQTHYLKVGRPGALEREARMDEFFAEFGLAPRVEATVLAPDHDYLITQALDGDDGVSPEALRSPERLAEVFGRSLSIVHALPSDTCPFRNRTAEMLALARRNLAEGRCSAELVPEGLERGRAAFERLSVLAQTDAVIHGDYCLPNIVLKDFKLVGFLDWGNGGYGDSHYDLYWGLWTLNYNLGTSRFGETFLNAYGRDRVNDERIEFHRLLSGFMEESTLREVKT